ncbi:hypothetical protein C9374_008779 [Naegleria lovaniensis]|uniref:Uncharacterized protein n=1 Tax=Naegleria lovaniensis TaxID=51637 RepID=A0AA88GEU8_NAELO|nr:uncharacterized protein C9374_008779 [Naegleria lovaniensis]KAG2378157.1 hypothetical protein C9374_008779 [Naegleria lovaniensis]
MSNLRKIAKNMGLSEEEWRRASRIQQQRHGSDKIMHENHESMVLNSEVSVSLGSEQFVSSEAKDQYMRFLDYSPETKRVLETFELDTNMSTNPHVKQYFKTDKEGNCKLSIQPQFLQRVEQVDEIEGVLISFHPGFFCIDIVCSSLNVGVVDRAFEKDIQTGWIRVVVNDEFGKDVPSNSSEDEEEMSGEGL